MSIVVKRTPKALPDPYEALRAVRNPVASVLAHAMAALTGPDLSTVPHDIPSGVSWGFSRGARLSLSTQDGENAAAAARAATALVGKSEGST